MEAGSLQQPLPRPPKKKKNNNPENKQTKKTSYGKTKESQIIGLEGDLPLSLGQIIHS